MDKQLPVDEMEKKSLQCDDVRYYESKDDPKDVPREQWARKTEYLLSLIGYSVGLGVVWRFPYLCLRNGGGLGFCMVMISFLCSWYYSLIVAWILCYLFYSFYPTQPWASCDNDWNTEHCIVIRSNQLPVGFTNQSLLNDFNSSVRMHVNTASYDSTIQNGTMKLEVPPTAATEFWRYRVLGISSGIDDIGLPQWHLVLALFLSNLSTFLCVMRGVRSVGKVAYVTAVLPYLLLTVILIRSLTLEGSIDGVIYYLKPDFSKLLTFKVWFEAALQVFYSLGPAWGGVLTMASYNRFHNKCLGNFYCGFVVFSILGFLAHESGLTIAEIAESGPGLVFQVYPEALTRLPLPNLWALLFFIMLFTVGLDSQFGMLETILGGLKDNFPDTLGRRKNLLLFLVFAMYLTSSLIFATPGAVYIFTLIDWYSSVYCIFLTSCFECIIVGWIYGADRFSRDVEMMTGRRIHTAIRISWCIVTPVAMIVALIMTILSFSAPSYANYIYPKYSEIIGVLVALLSVVPLPVVFIFKLVQASGSPLKRLKSSLQPSQDWVPNHQVVKNTYELYTYNGNLWSRIKTNLFGSPSK